MPVSSPSESTHDATLEAITLELEAMQAIAETLAAQGDWRHAYQHLRVALDESLHDALTTVYPDAQLVLPTREATAITVPGA